MSFFSLVRREMYGSLDRLIVISALGGISTAAILTAINSGAQAADSGKVSLWSAALFIVALFLFIKTQQYILITATAEIEAIIHKLRLRLMDHVRHSELLPLESIGRGEIVGAITKETATLTQMSNTLAFAAQGAVLIFFVALYVAYLSLLVFTLSIIILGIAAVLFHARSRQLAMASHEASNLEHRLFDRLMDILNGFKEVRLNTSRSEALFQDIVEVSRAAANIKIRAQSETFKRMIFLQAALYTLLGAIAFAVPTFSGAMEVESVTKTITALVFVVGTCFGLVQAIPIISAANTAADNIERLEARLLTTIPTAEVAAVEPPKRFQKIEMRNVVFRYVDKWSDAVFQVGPIDFTLQSGDLVFITGGNGSGKSTLLKLLAGLYKPDSGEITFDGVRVNDSTRQAYRELIAAIFPDYHLFEKLYGVPDPDPAEVDSLLAKRPLLLLDEWAADQDPEFRRKFYYDLLPELKRSGETVVAITHDDRYIDEMDLPARRLRMEDGRFAAQQTVENR